MPTPSREDDLYPTATLGDRLGDALHLLARNWKLLLVLAIPLAVWLVPMLTTPARVPIEQLTAGMCITVPTASIGNVTAARPIGTPEGAALVLVTRGADVIRCSDPHSHEVAALFVDPAPAGTPYPGEAALVEQQRPACELAFAAYVGHPVSGSRYELTIVVPGPGGWAQGRRAGACLVSRADGQLLDSPAKGSGA